MQLGQRKIRGLLIDLDGVLHVGAQPVPGAARWLGELNRSGIPHCFVTNTTTQSLATLHGKLRDMGFDFPLERLLTAPSAARHYLERKRRTRCKLLLADDVRRDFEGFEQTDTGAQAVVLGDIGRAWNYDLLDQVFHLLMDGAELVALHRNKFWQTDTGLALDIGAFVAGLEYASGRAATVVGKPNAEFFMAGVERMGLRPSEVAMIGDDIDSDVGGAQAIGLLGILVKTGKYRAEYAERSNVEPDLVVDSIASLSLD
ncbi:MAG TPA: TIGR01458 family HAD-type hydrolase [Polyangiaceae bacterium]|nr:TIGR01458 family HAD-type hydrolase [Polyangiaceae bacterium]